MVLALVKATVRAAAGKALNASREMRDLEEAEVAYLLWLNLVKTAMTAQTVTATENWETCNDESAE